MSIEEDNKMKNGYIAETKGEKLLTKYTNCICMMVPGLSEEDQNTLKEIKRTLWDEIVQIIDSKEA
jgi:hypothetical protein